MGKKKQILKEATKLISVKGFRDTTMTELARRSGVAHGTIFYHYENKEHLFLAILEEIKKEFTGHFDRYLASKRFESGLEMMEDIIGFYLHLSSLMEDRFLLLHRHDAHALAKANPRCRDHLESIYNCLVDVFEHAISKGQEDGSITDLPSRKVALIIFAMVDGLVRFNTYCLYDAGALYEDLIHSIKKILRGSKPKKQDQIRC